MKEGGNETEVTKTMGYHGLGPPERLTGTGKEKRETQSCQ